MDSTQPDTPWGDTPPAGQRVAAAIGRIASVLRAASWRFATDEGLTPTQIELLQLLASRPQGLRPTWLARQLSVTPATVGDAIAALAAKGLVTKGRASDDGRALAVRPTAAGLALAARSAEASSLVQDAVQALPPAMQEQALVALLALIARLQLDERFPELRTCPGCVHFEILSGPGEPRFRCALVGAPLPRRMLRVDCPEQEPAPPARLRSALAALSAG